MEFRREKSKASIRAPDGGDLFNEDPQFHNATTTPRRVNNRSEDEESPFFPCSTQEMRDDVDVLWDYNSPHTKAKTTIVRKSKKRLNLQQSPKVPFRRHASSNNEQIKQDFCKLREELMALREEIAKPDHEESLILSPREEEAFKRTEEFDENFVDEGPLFESQYEEDPFDDNMDDKLILFSQQVESEISKITPAYKENKFNPGVLPTNLPRTCVSNCDISKSNPNFNSKNHPIKDINKKITDRVSNLQESDMFNDSFDNVLSQMDPEEFDQLTQVVDIKQYKPDANVYDTNNKSKVFPRSHSDNYVKIESVEPVTNKVEWHRTQSFERYNKAELPEEQLREVERKRRKAKAKLEAKKRSDLIFTTIPEKISDSPLKCSPEEIEKKRLQALAKLEAKKQQEIIERKKQEAMRRREENRKKNVAHVKSSLSTRL